MPSSVVTPFISPQSLAKVVVWCPQRLKVLGQNCIIKNWRNQFLLQQKIPNSLRLWLCPNPCHTRTTTPKNTSLHFYTDEFHHYPVDIPQNCLDVIDKNIALDADNVFAKIGDVQKTAILLFAEYINAATTIAAQSGGGGGGATSGWGRDKDEDELSWAYRCAMMANRLCRPRKKQGYGR
mgnify:CR=1 FL=1